MWMRWKSLFLLFINRVLLLIVIRVVYLVSEELEDEMKKELRSFG